MQFQKFVQTGLTFALTALPVYSQTILSAKIKVPSEAHQNQPVASSDYVHIVTPQLPPTCLQIPTKLDGSYHYRCDPTTPLNHKDRNR